jgi:hypothetical protein
MFSNTFAGIVPASGPAFIAAQVLGGLGAFAVVKALYSGVTPPEAVGVIVPRLDDPHEPDLGSQPTGAQP